MPIATRCGEDLVEPAILPSDKYIWMPIYDQIRNWTDNSQKKYRYINKYQISNKQRDTEINNLNNSQNSPPFAAGVEKLK
jgi:hypothetical protein